MRRPPSNLDDFLQGGENQSTADTAGKTDTTGKTDTASAQSPKADIPATPKSKAAKPTPEASTGEERRAEKPMVGKPKAEKKPAARRRAAQPKTRKASIAVKSEPVPVQSPAAGTSAAGTTAKSDLRETPTTRDQQPAGTPADQEGGPARAEANDRGRSRTVAGEAAATVIMSVRVPIELRERLEDILAAYSGVTFSDLVIRGLQTMVSEVESRHRERTGGELPRRQERPEFPL